MKTRDEIHANLKGPWVDEDLRRGFDISAEQYYRLGDTIETLLRQNGVIDQSLNNAAGKEFTSLRLYTSLQEQFPRLFPKHENNQNAGYVAWARQACKILAIRRKANIVRRGEYKRGEIQLRQSSSSASSVDGIDQDSTNDQTADGLHHGSPRPFGQMVLAVEWYTQTNRKMMCRLTELCATNIAGAGSLSADSLSWDKFVAWIKKQEEFVDGDELILYDDKEDQFPITDEGSWRAALHEMHQEGRRRFEFIVQSNDLHGMSITR